MQKLVKLDIAIIRFIIVGCINTGVDFITFSLLYSFAGADKMVCQITGYSMGIINSFIMNKLWTFESRESSIGTTNQIVRFILVNFVSLGISLIGLNYFNIYYGVNVYFSKVIVTITAQVVNYTGYKMLVFSNN